MSKTSTNTFDLSYAPDVVMNVIASPEFQKENFLKQENPDAEVKEVSRSENKLVIRADVTEYAKGVTGVDKSRTEKTVTTFTWDLKARKATWTYDSPHGKRVDVSGSVHVKPAGDGSTITETFSVTVKIPLVGGKAEKMVIKEVESYYPKYKELVKAHCEKS